MGNGKLRVAMASLCAVIVLGGVAYYGKSKKGQERFQRLASSFVQRLDTVLTTKSNEFVAKKDVEQQLKIFKDQEAARKTHNHNSVKFAELQYSYAPQIVCPTMVRLGVPGDGGKWVCNPWLARNNCVVFSLGVNSDSSFEQQIQNSVTSRCRVFGFDSNAGFKSTFNRVPNGQFLAYQITSTTNAKANQYAIEDIAKKFNVDKIDFLKIDIEGAEFSAIPVLFHDVSGISTLKVPICQLMVEVHTRQSTRDWVKLLSVIEKVGFLLFQRESNSYSNPACFEYAWIHKDCLSDYSVTMPIMFNNF